MVEVAPYTTMLPLNGRLREHMECYATTAVQHNVWSTACSMACMMSQASAVSAADAMTHAQTRVPALTVHGRFCLLHKALLDSSSLTH